MRRTLARLFRLLSPAAVAVWFAFAPAPAAGQPKVVLISLDGATPQLVSEFMRDGTIPPHTGLGLLARRGVSAERNVTVDPSLTAPSHIAIATGSTAARNDILANTFHLVASPFTSNISGFGAPIGGYSIHGPAETADPTAEPLWLALRAAGKKVDHRDLARRRRRRRPGARARAAAPSSSPPRSARWTTRCLSARSTGRTARWARPRARAASSSTHRISRQRRRPRSRSSPRRERRSSARSCRRRRRPRRSPRSAVRRVAGPFSSPRSIRPTTA